LKIEVVREMYLRYGGCAGCLHREGFACSAFRSGIPIPILAGEVSHVDPVPGDGGVVYAPNARTSANAPFVEALLEDLGEGGKV
jgi:hypothetical protein